MVTYNWEGTQKLGLLPKEWRVWTPHWATGLLRPAPERWIHKTSSFGNQQGCYAQGLQGYHQLKNSSYSAHALRNLHPSWPQCRGSWLKGVQILCENVLFFNLWSSAQGEDIYYNTHLVLLNNSFGTECFLCILPLLHVSLLGTPGKELIPSSGTLILLSATQVTLSDCMKSHWTVPLKTEFLNSHHPWGIVRSNGLRILLYLWKMLISLSS